MATATAYNALLDQILVEPGLNATRVEDRLGYNFSAATVAATSLTTTDSMLVTLAANAPSERLEGLLVYLYTAGELRTVTTISVTAGGTATINFVGPNATVQAGATTAYLLRVPWAELRDIANDALEYIPCECFVPVGDGPTDFDMQLAGTTNWTATTATLAKQTVALEVFAGARSLAVTLTAANGYAESGIVNMGHAQRGVMFALAKADTGTGILRSLNDTGATLESVSFTQEDWVFIRRAFTLSITGEGARLRLLGTANLDQIDWQCAWIMKQGSQRMIRLSAWQDERFKIKGLMRAVFPDPGDEADTWLADTHYMERLIEGQDYDFNARQADANPNLLYVRRSSLLEEPLFLLVEAPYSAPYGVAATFTTDTTTTICPQHLFTAKWKERIGGAYPDLFPGLEARGREEYEARSRARVIPRPRPQRRIRLVL